MITLAVMLFVYLIAIKLSDIIKPLYFSSFFFVFIITTLILRLNLVYYLELSDMPYYMVFFCLLLVFIYSLVDILRNKELNLTNYCQYSIVLAVSLENNWLSSLFVTLMFYLSRKNKIKIDSNKTFIYTLLVMIMSSTHYTGEIINQKSVVFTCLFYLMFLFSVLKINQAFVFILSFISIGFSLEFFPREFFYFYPVISLLSSISLSKEILERCLEKISILSRGVFLVEKLSTEEVVEYKREVKVKKVKSFELDIVSAHKPGVEIKYIYISGILLSIISYLAVWGDGL